MQVNYDFHHAVTPEKLDQLLDGLRKKAIRMLYNEPSPLETRVLTRRFGLPNSASIDTYLATDGYKAFLKAAEMTPEQIIEEMKASNLRGRGGAGFPDRDEVELRAAHVAQAEVHRGQCATRASRAPARTAC